MKKYTHKCCSCDSMATWKRIRPMVDCAMYYCDDCIRFENKEEFEHSNNGFERCTNNDNKIVAYTSVVRAFDLCSKTHGLTSRDSFKVEDLVNKLFVADSLDNDGQHTYYNNFMSKLGNKINEQCENCGFYGKELQMIGFYRGFRDMVGKQKFSECEL